MNLRGGQAAPSQGPGRPVRLPSRTSTSTDSSTPSTSSQDPVLDPVRLDAPRPGILRTANEYVKVPRANDDNCKEEKAESVIRRGTRWTDTNNFDHPKVHTPSCVKKSLEDALREQGLGEIRPLVTGKGARAKDTVVECTAWKRVDAKTHLKKPARCRHDHDIVNINNNHHLRHSTVPLPKPVDQQPRPILPLRVQPTSSLSSGAAGLLCADCGRCRCRACSNPRPLPSCWLCNNSCLLSADTCVEYVTCLCCIKGCLYHLHSIGREDDRGPQVTDADVCSCSSPGCCVRWTCLTLSGLCLPCVWCYLPLRGVQALVSACYAKCTDNACRCYDNRHFAHMDVSTKDRFAEPEKRLRHEPERNNKHAISSRQSSRHCNNCNCHLKG